ncbi:4'-phosphopantetheinyl transferase superfamily protein [Erwinia sp. CPCC 100877]|nr:4'-phosphopantetheinyl transferase superfamily protein [Erwinia sp. CPCC 100877]
MLIIDNEHFHSPFLPLTSSGWLASQPGVRFCEAFFDRKHYRTELWQQLAIPFPDSLAGAATKRRAEFLAGRWCSQQLLNAAGIHGHVLQTEDRAPRWPAGVWGSISHSGERVLALMVAGITPWRVGIDLERFDAEVMRNCGSEIINDAELLRLGAAGYGGEWGILLAFSAKESLYKALWPEVRRYFGFHAAALVAANEGNFVLELRENLTTNLKAGLRFHGEWRYEAPWISTLICLPAH